ncbi:S-adenosyl-L-methionine-dependent methyltransferase [Tricharina praecox]|uniref:S-adenosyl-L-methionine-dependent methyltransferase n=1 Tax=Tricharina praecox TaxID=43433 RepID=UPI00221FF455|nr:S-adenosyl-L-methionine-dependent methyltransferase [Tricharina praecox]KAI5842829.1 S-adenosyl-L-methionine-dependent methyltransferase [Tricharina praecox]
MNHEMFMLLWNGGLHKAPITENPHNILDVGTGTGIWAVDIAEKFPSAEVVGVDLSPIQPKWVPTNCRFEIDDVEREWTFNENLFDLIHCRNISQSISDWPKLLKNIYRCTAPGGFVEVCEAGLYPHSDDGTLELDNPLLPFFDLLKTAMIKLGRPPVDGPIMAQQLRRAGFKDVHVTKVKQPWAPWPKDKRLKQLGAIALLQGETGYRAYGLAAFTRVLEMETAAAEKICDDASAAHHNPRYHVYNYVYSVYGRKPTEDGA